MTESRIPPEKIDPLRREATVPAETMEALRRAVSIPAETMEAVRELASRVQLPEFSAPVRDAMAEALRQFRASWEQAVPDNWAGLEPDEVMETIERVRLTGYALVWLPRVEIVREVLAADASQAATVLLIRKDDVLEDAVKCLGNVSDPDLVFVRTALEEAIETLRDGCVLAAQALASVAFSSEIHEFFGMGTGAVRRRMENSDPNDFPISQLRLRTIFVAGAKALAEFRPDTARPPRHEFNRHNSAHRLTREQWTVANALSGIMLATALLREMHERSRRHLN